MRQSKAGRKLTPDLKAACDPIYNRDRVRYNNLCRWVWTAQCGGWPDEAIAETLRMADRHLDGIDNYFAYLNKLLPKANGRAHEGEAKKYKTEVGQIANEFVEFLRQKKNVRSVQG